MTPLSRDLKLLLNQNLTLQVNMTPIGSRRRIVHQAVNIHYIHIDPWTINVALGTSCLVGGGDVMNMNFVLYNNIYSCIVILLCCILITRCVPINHFCNYIK